ncbi:hypothetical protein AWJ20_152 [Sugiyamaella lignohabitans]|uniref:Uncharacterized protein n=1 Tax=Sugiyamaella lignohabitans TaxID=796027 RepID=A0A167CNK1_9ASCO|nr:uncharacterized protein AWJ20_152 [Sugiyamaella lignohabitans]ANB11925.1 hypothetical protein AWJ20_152 [Sugiyamaella lignohabitans]
MSSWLYLDDYPFNTDHSNGSGPLSGSSFDTSGMWFDNNNNNSGSNSINYKDYPTALLSNPTNFSDIGGFDDFLFEGNNNHQNVSGSHHTAAPASTSSSSSPVLPQTPTDMMISTSNHGPYLGEVNDFSDSVSSTLAGVSDIGASYDHTYSNTYTNTSSNIASSSNSSTSSNATISASTSGSFSQDGYKQPNVSFSTTTNYTNDPSRLQYSPSLTDSQMNSFSSFSMDFSEFKAPLVSSVIPSVTDDLTTNTLPILPPSPKSSVSPTSADTPKSKRRLSNTRKVGESVQFSSSTNSTASPITVSSSSAASSALSGANPPRTGRKHSESRMSLPELYNLMGLGHNPTEARTREKRVLDLLQKEGFLLGQRTWIRDTEQAERQRIIDNIYAITNKDYHYTKDLIELIIRRGTYYVMQGRLRRIRRNKRAQELSNNDPDDTTENDMNL